MRGEFLKNFSCDKDVKIVAGLQESGGKLEAADTETITAVPGSSLAEWKVAEVKKLLNVKLETRMFC
jgi:hypothetical protein